MPLGIYAPKYSWMFILNHILSLVGKKKNDGKKSIDNNSVYM